MQKTNIQISECFERLGRHAIDGREGFELLSKLSICLCLFLCKNYDRVTIPQKRAACFFQNLLCCQFSSVNSVTRVQHLGWFLFIFSFTRTVDIRSMAAVRVANVTSNKTENIHLSLSCVAINLNFYKQQLVVIIMTVLISNKS